MTYDMTEGTFALIDCLGWKGIWHRAGLAEAENSSRRIIKKVESIKKQHSISTTTVLQGLEKLNIKVDKKVFFLSDTVAIGIPPIDHPDTVLTPELKKALSVEMACLIISDILDQFLEEEPYLTMRGCVTYGLFAMKDNIILGPAVDEAANNYEAAQGAFVWLRPSASEKLQYLHDWRESEAAPTINRASAAGLNQEGKNVIHGFVKSTKNPPAVIWDFEVPIKDFGSYTCPVVNPLFFIRESDQRAITIERYATTFDQDNLDILVKKQNTLRFLATAADKTLEYYENDFDYDALEQVFGNLRPS